VLIRALALALVALGSIPSPAQDNAPVAPPTSTPPQTNPVSAVPDLSPEIAVPQPVEPLDPHFPISEDPPAAPREFRAAWVATVTNIDWPSKPGLSTWQQQAEIIAILNRAVELGLNALIVQVRTTADALYPSQSEPWSQYLSGAQGEPPFPYYDPLKLWIEEGHKRGLEIHAWFNPYRARFANSKATLSSMHLGRARPQLVKEYGPYLWLDPGDPEAAEHSLRVFMDVVERYDIDGIHIDDYFYPYPVKNPNGEGELDFPDEDSWKRYQESGGKRGRADWRRQNVNTLVEAIYTGVKKRKKHVKFGISPFGLGRPGSAPGIKGFDQFEKLYADAALWLQKGWCDYFTPQLYWPVEQKGQEFPVLLDYWISENKEKRHLWPGLFTSRVIDGRRKWAPKTVLDQIEVTRARAEKASGHVHFSMKALMQPADGLTDTLGKRTYTRKALVPPSPWLDDRAPRLPQASISERDGRKAVKLQGHDDDVFLWGVWTLDANGWLFDVVPGTERSIPIREGVTKLVLTSVDRAGNESRRVTMPLR
jgi:uncharacterized lipoprotein YddW (UPF0748 family)